MNFPTFRAISGNRRRAEMFKHLLCFILLMDYLIPGGFFHYSLPCKKVRFSIAKSVRSAHFHCVSELTNFSTFRGIKGNNPRGGFVRMVNSDLRLFPLIALKVDKFINSDLQWNVHLSWFSSVLKLKFFWGGKFPPPAILWGGKVLDAVFPRFTFFHDKISALRAKSVYIVWKHQLMHVLRLFTN